MKASTPAIYTSPELEQLRQLVAGARSRLAELEVEYAKEKSRVDVVQAMLFRHLREHYQKRDRLRLTVDYRRKFLDALIRGDSDELKRAEKKFEQTQAQADRDYEELSAAADKKQNLTAEQEAELTRLWKKLVKLYNPDRFADEPDKLETYHKLTAAINRAKDKGDIETLREIADDPQGFILRQGWASLDFDDVEELAQLRRLHETLQEEIAAVRESLKQLRGSPDYELCQLSERKPGVLDELAAERTKQLEIEIADLEKQAEHLANEIEQLKQLTKTQSKQAEIVASPNQAVVSTTKSNAAKNSTHMKPADFGIIIAKLIAALLLFAALGRHPYDYYTLLRWITCAVCAFTAFQAAEMKKSGWLWVFIIVAIVFNPLVPLRLKRDTWALVDIAAAVLLLLSIAVMDIRKPRP
jgi:DNA repair exonuclease SbcCD ATPase subunit